MRYQSKSAQFCISLATANVNSLHAGPDGHRGKLQYIRDQMKALHLLFLGIQESRADEVCSQTDDVLRLGSGADKGHHGVELWINMLQPFAYTGKKAHFLNKQHVVVVRKDARVLIANICHPLWQAWIVVAHAPQSGIPEDQRQAWWASLTEQFMKFVKDEEVYVLIDANAEPGPTDGIHVGPRQTKTSKSTKFLCEFLETWKLALPCTFSCHSGSQATWTTPDGRSQHCIDHVCLPLSRLGDCKFSRIVEELDLGNGHLDHTATAVEVVWHQVVQLPLRRSRTASIYRESIDAAMHASLAQYDVPPWEQDIHTHVENHNQHVLQTLATHCAKAPNTAKKSFITPDIWELRTCKLQCRRVVRDIEQRCRQELIRAVWLGWKQQCLPEKEDMSHYAQIYFPYTVALSCWQLHQGVQLHVLAVNLKKALKGARQKAVQMDVTALPDEVAASEVLRTVKKHVGPTNLKNLKKPTLPMLKDMSGHMCVQPEQLRDAWIDFFGQMEGGIRMTWEDLIDRWRSSLGQFQQSEVSLGPEDVPCLTDLEMSFRRVKKGKALGPDGIPPELCKACPTTLARHYFSALMKMLIHGQESLHHKGGTLVPAYKGKGPTTEPASYRSLLISSHMGKVLHRTIRQHQSSMYEQYLCAQQLGGRKKVPVTLGLHEARAFLRTGQHQGLSVGLLLVDLTEAFYRVLRPLAVGGQYSDVQIAQIVHKLGMSSDTLHELHEHLKQPSAVEQAHLPCHLRKVLHALHTDTYFQIHGQEDCCHTSVGSRPGDCFADVVFSYLFSRVLKAYQQKLAEADLQQWVADVHQFDPFGQQERSDLQVPYLGPIWMDDVCIGLTAATPRGLMQKAGIVTSLLLDTLKGYGLTPNLKKGKTELLFSLRGPGVRKCQQQLFGPTASGTMDIVCEQEVCQVSVVGQYQHLGGILHHKGDHRVEMKRRVALAHAAFNAHRKVLYHNPDIPLLKRTQLFNTLILSKMLYGCESWVLRDRRSKEFLHAAIMKLYRRILRCPHDEHCTDEWVLSKLHMPSPTELLRQARLRYVGTLHACSHVVTWDLLNQDSEWCALIQDDLAWMWKQLSNSSNLSPPNQGLAAWSYLWQYHRNYWKGLIKRAVQHAVLQRHNGWVVKQGHQTVLDILQKHGHVVLPPETNRRPVPCMQAYGCFACGVSFRSKGGEGAHMFRRHGLLSSIRYLFDQTRCEACMKEYYTYGKLHNHLRHSHQCRITLQRRLPELQPQEGHGSVVDRALERQHDGLLPPMASHGPSLPVPLPRDIQEFDTEFYGECAEILLSDRSVTAKNAAVRTMACTKKLSWTQFSLTLDRFKAHVQHTDLEAFHMSMSELDEMFEDLLNVDTWPWMKHAQEDVQEFSCADLEWQCDNADASNAVAPRPQGFGVHRFILHAFSGRRRQGDFQFYLDAIAENHPGIVLHTLSVDIVLDSCWGDISDEKVRQFWVSAAWNRWVIGFLGGPPCETWSRAREHQIQSNSRCGPRVIRTSTQPWGLDSLSLKEIRQILVGNQLMHFCITMLTVLYITGGCGALEHPARPPNETSASIWNTPLINLLLQLPGFHLWEFAQGLLGAITAKPTMLLSLNLPTLGQQICAWRVVDNLPKGASIGQGTDGKFRTFVLKEYPPALCGAIATSFMQTLCTVPVSAVQIPCNFFARCSTMECKVYSEELGPDFAGGASLGK